ncbi:MAG TPA: adenylate/guanylate cyclase domain-containing protein [Streptosporangiaceae bacterium]|nr:adenylate/guanylate cyclase domain-containing protein [Streptosporangiaceae bacterium]
MPAEERKLATVLFADLVGSTQFAGDQDPERVRAVLDRFYDAMAAEVERAGGTVEKFVGDAVMAVFGAPAAHEDDAERALHAALGMQRRMGELFGGRLALRVGVNTGDVVVGQPREGSSFVTGDAVNVCARLEQAAGAGEILVGERTVAAARGAFEFAEPTTVQAKGKPGGVVCRRLVRALSLMRPRGITGLQPVFVGRGGELADLQQVYERVISTGQPHLVTVVGDAGVGKTRLVREFWQWLGGVPQRPLLRTGRCLSYGHGITYWPLGEVLKEHFGIRESDPPDVVAERLVGREGLGFTLGLAPPGGMHPLTVRDRLQNSWVEFLQELTSERPAVLLLEDLHWAGDELCDLLQMFAGQVAGPMLLVVTARPELLDERPGWPAGGLLVRLEALPAAEAAQLVGGLLGSECPAPIRELIAERAEGNPFFVEELIATLVDRGVLARENDGWSFGELPPNFFVPDTVQAVLAARIDSLPRAEKPALQTAAVVGRIFWSDPVCELVEGADPEFGVLQERDFVLPHARSSIEGQREWLIRHALTREVAYESLLKAKRARLHAGFAEWLERNGKSEAEHAPLLAHHYAEAVRPEDLDLAWLGREEHAEALRAKAVLWSRRAADLAIGRYEIDQGLALLHRALSLEHDPREQASIWQRVGQACALKYDGEGFWQAMAKALEIGGPSAEVYADLALQTGQRAGMWVQQPDPEWTLVGGWIQQALELAQEGSLAKGNALVALADFDSDEAAARSALEIAERLGNLELRCTALNTIAGLAMVDRDLDRACTMMDQVMELLPVVPDPDVCSTALMSAVFVYLKSGHLEQAAAASEHAVEIATGLTPHHRVHGAAWQILLASVTGRWDELRALAGNAEQAVDDNRAAGTPCALDVAILLNCAIGQAQAGDQDDARRLEAKADGLGMAGGRFYQGWFEPPRIRLALVRHETGQLADLAPADFDWEWEPVSTFLDALAALGDGERIEAEAPKWLQQGTFAEPFALRALGVARSDQALLQQALKQFEAMDLSWHAEQTRHLL